jgi:prepilin-type N-terminal cleavage/methylation domain-containing protein/prepilin-type processing-associated H-X9-DG protein
MHLKLPSRRPSARGGFTLVELLVVFAVIAILIALAFPVFLRMQAGARSTRCISGLRQLQAANLGHAAENDGWFVPVFTNSAADPPKRTPWHNHRGFCTRLGRPTDQAAAIPAEIRCPEAKVEGQSGYGYNFTGLSGGINDPGFSRAVSQAQIPRPGQTIAFIDALDWQVHRSASDRDPGTETATTQATAYRHGNRDTAHAVFWDGHAEALSRTKLAASKYYWDMLEPESAILP